MTTVTLYRGAGIAIAVSALSLSLPPLAGQARSPAAQAPAATPSRSPARVQAAPVPARAADAVPILPVTIVARYPHDRTAFTEGLAWSNGALYESTGLEGRSEVRRVSLADGRVLARATIDPRQFGEGLAVWRDQVVTLTWHDGIAHRWNARTLRRVGTARYTGEGWGLAARGNVLARSDGTATITFHDAATLRETRRMPVTLRGAPLDQINELEYVDGALLANVWHAPFLVRIDATGRVTAIVDLRPLVAEVAATDPEAVANGIAWDAAKRRLFVTGKLWPTIFEVRIAEPR